MTARVTSAMVARAAAVAFALLAVAVAAIQSRRPGDAPAVATEAPDRADADPIQAELIRCAGLGEAGAHDSGCLRAWAENRRRFLAPNARPTERLPVEAVPNTPSAAGSARAPADQPQPKDQSRPSADRPEAR